MRYPQFGRKGVLGVARLAAANTARDGSGTIASLITGRRKVVPVTISGNTISVAAWSLISDLEWIKEYNGDVVSFVSGTPPPGASLNTDYRIGELSVNTGTDVATFKLYDASADTVIALSSSGTNPVIQLNVGTRVDRIRFISAQASVAASSAMVGRLFLKDNLGGSWRLMDEVALPTITSSNTVVGQKQEILLPSGYVLPGGWQLGATISVYAGVQDQYDIHAIGAAF